MRVCLGASIYSTRYFRQFSKPLSVSRRMIKSSTSRDKYRARAAMAPSAFQPDSPFLCSLSYRRLEFQRRSWFRRPRYHVFLLRSQAIRFLGKCPRKYASEETVEPTRERSRDSLNFTRSETDGISPVLSTTHLTANLFPSFRAISSPIFAL